MTKEKMTRLVDRLAELKERVEEINKEKLSIEAEIQVEAEKLLQNSKSKTVAFGGTGGNRVVVTKASSFKIADNSKAEPFKKFFSGNYASRVTEKTIYETDADSKRAISALCSGEYIKGSIKDLIDGIDCPEDVRASLVKKIKGKKFETDVKNFVAFTSMTEDEAFVNAYLASEINAYQTISTILKENEMSESDENIQQLTELAKNIGYVTSATKITVQTSL